MDVDGSCRAKEGSKARDGNLGKVNGREWGQK